MPFITQKENLEEFRKLRGSVDVVVGGFPCQAFSISGLRRGFEDVRGTMFFEIARAIKQIEPRYFVLENVKGLLSHKKGETFATILSTISELGYDAEWVVFNSKDFGVPQNRERVYIVGHIRGECTCGVFSTFKPTRESRASNEDKLSGVYRVKEATKQGYAIANVGDSINLSRPNSKTRRGRVGKNTANTLLTSDEQGVVLSNHKIRKLTPRECWRLQGFPDWAFDKAKGAGVSDSQLYKQAGNAVTVDVVKYIAEKIYSKMKGVS